MVAGATAMMRIMVLMVGTSTMRMKTTTNTRDPPTALEPGMNSNHKTAATKDQEKEERDYGSQQDVGKAEAVRMTNNQTSNENLHDDAPTWTQTSRKGEDSETMNDNNSETKTRTATSGQATTVPKEKEREEKEDKKGSNDNKTEMTILMTIYRHYYVCTTGCSYAMTSQLGTSNESNKCSLPLLTQESKGPYPISLADGNETGQKMDLMKWDLQRQSWYTPWQIKQQDQYNHKTLLPCSKAYVDTAPHSICSSSWDDLRYQSHLKETGEYSSAWSRTQQKRSHSHKNYTEWFSRELQQIPSKFRRTGPPWTQWFDEWPSYAYECAEMSYMLAIPTLINAMIMRIVRHQQASGSVGGTQCSVTVLGWTPDTNSSKSPKSSGVNTAESSQRTPPPPPVATGNLRSTLADVVRQEMRSVIKDMIPEIAREVAQHIIRRRRGDEAPHSGPKVAGSDAHKEATPIKKMRVLGWMKKHDQGSSINYLISAMVHIYWMGLHSPVGIMQGILTITQYYIALKTGTTHVVTLGQVALYIGITHADGRNECLKIFLLAAYSWASHSHQETRTMGTRNMEVKGWSKETGKGAVHTPQQYERWTEEWKGTDDSLIPVLARIPGEDHVLEIYTDGGATTTASWAFTAAGCQLYHGPVTSPTDDIAEHLRAGNTTVDNNAGELQGLLEATYWAIEEIGKVGKTNRTPITLVHFHCDSTYTIDASMGIMSPQQNGPLVRQIRENLDEIRRQAQLVVTWVEAHRGNGGNELADLGATLSLRGIHCLPPRYYAPPPPHHIRRRQNQTILATRQEQAQLLIRHEYSGITLGSQTEIYCLCQQFCEQGDSNRVGKFLQDQLLLQAPVHMGEVHTGIILLVHCQFDPNLIPLAESGAIHNALQWMQHAILPSNLQSALQHPNLDTENADLGSAAPIPEQPTYEPSTSAAATTASESTAQSPHQLTGQKPNPTNTQTKRPAGPGAAIVKAYQATCGPLRMRLTVYHMCAGTGLGDMAMLQAIDQLKADGIEIEILGAITRFEIDDTANRMARSLLSSVTTQQVDYRGDMSEADILENIGHLPADTHVYVQSGTPCESISRGIMYKNPTSHVGPHAAPSNLMWLDQQFSIRAQEQIGSRLVCVKENVIPAFIEWQSMMESNLGYPHRTDGLSKIGLATRERVYYVSHEILPELVMDDDRNFVLYRERDTRSWVIRGTRYSWPCLTQNQDKAPPTLKAIYPSLLARHADPQQLKPLVPSERNYLRKMTLQPAAFGILPLFAGPRQLGTWLGMTPKEVETIMQMCQCMGEIEPIHGRPREYFEQRPNLIGRLPPESSYAPCQRHRLCHNCGLVAQQLGKAWSIPSAANIVYKVLLTATVQKARNHSVVFAYQHRREHVCTEHCQHVLQLGQAQQTLTATPYAADNRNHKRGREGERLHRDIID